MFIVFVVAAFGSSLLALDTTNSGCDIQKSQTFNGVDMVLDIPAHTSYSSLEHEYDRTQTCFISNIIGPEHSALIMRQDVVTVALNKVDICIINGGYSRTMGWGEG